MRIAFVLPGIPGSPTGGSKVVFEYANALSEIGHKVTIIYLHEEKKSNIQNLAYKLSLVFKANHTEPKWFPLDKDINRIVAFDSKEIKQTPYDLIVATAIQTFFFVTELKARFKAMKNGYFIQDHENWLFSEDEVCKTYHNNVPKIVVAKWLEDIVKPYSEGPVYLISNSINTDVFYNNGRERKKHSLIFHYRSAIYKGCDCAIKVITRLKELYEDLDVSVVSIEERPDTLPDWCTYYRKLTPQEVAALNNKTQVFLCTSVEEGFGLPGLEAMACGCALVSTKYRGVMEYAIDGENALLAPVNDVDGLVNHVSSLFNDSDLYQLIQRNGEATGQERSLMKTTKMFEQVLTEIASS